MRPLNPDKWNREYAAHLLVRSGFGATPEQIDAAAGKSLKQTVDSLFLTPKDIAAPSWLTPESSIKPDRSAIQAMTEEERQRYRKNLRLEYRKLMRELSGWWVHRMVNTPCPLQEKMTLFWHGHFATSVRKVRVPYMMYLQNRTLRQHALGNWRELVTAVSQDPAMLIYLDNARSKKGAPNENFARELMELFTLGEGRYTEEDIKNAARAFTGWTVHPKQYAFLDNVKQHDNGPKLFFQQTGTFDGNDIIRMILKQKQAARFIVAKLWTFFAYEAPDEKTIDSLAATLQKNDYELIPLMKTIFMSEAFYSERSVRTQIKSPVQWLAGSCIALSIENPDPQSSVNVLRSLGQELFAPPNVKGWDGGYAWITTSSLTTRYNLAGQLVNHRKRMDQKDGERKQFGSFTVNTTEVLPKEKRSSLDVTQGYLEDRIYQTRLLKQDREKLEEYFGTLRPVDGWSGADVRNVLNVMMSTPYYQIT